MIYRSNPTPIPAHAKAQEPEKGAVPTVAPGSREAVVLRMLNAAAEAGVRCPTNQEIADALGMASTGGPARLVAALEDFGVISVRRYQVTRVVTISASGKSTAAPASSQPHWRDRPQHSKGG